ncbi:MAG: hypothetical protein JXQ29_11705 [Planctomycetes bacterium]|nr:hypothetical protein [Planctomycetota bacterium]
MARMAPFALALGLVVTVATSGPTQPPPGLEPEMLRATLRELVPMMSRTLGIQVLEPIPLRIVSRDQMKAALALDLEQRLLEVRRVAAEPEPAVHPVLIPERARQIAETVAAHLTPRYLIRCVHDGENVLLVAPANLAALLDPREIPSRQIPFVVRFELVRELTRLADDERARAAEDGPPVHETVEQLAARLAFLEGRAWWAAARLIRRSPRGAPLGEDRSSGTASAQGVEAEQLLYALIGDGVRRGYLGVEQLLEAGGPAAVAGRVVSPPRAFSDLPQLPQAQPTSPRPKDPLGAVLEAMTALHPGEDWSATTEEPDKKTVAARLGADLPGHQARTLAASLQRVVERTATHPALGQIHLSIATMANRSAAYAWHKAEEQRLMLRTQNLEREGYTVEETERRTHDLAGFPVLTVIRMTARADDETLQVHRLLAICGNHSLQITSTHPAVTWEQLRAFLVAVRPHLEAADRFGS